MTDRGEYRGIRVCLIDGPDFQALSPGAKLVFYTLKLKCGLSGICVIPALHHTLAEHTGFSDRDAGTWVGELQEKGWIMVEKNVVWIIDGLKHEPGYFAGNRNHQKGLLKYLDTLPRLSIVEGFRKHYAYLPGLSPSDDRNIAARVQPAEKNPTVTSAGEPPAGPPAKKAVETWVQEGVGFWAEAVGPISYPRFGRALKASVDKYGWGPVRDALCAYVVEMTEQGKTCKLEWFVENIAVRVNGKPTLKSKIKPWEQEQHDLGIAKQPQVVERVKAYKANLNGEGESWWTEMRRQAKSVNRHPIAFAHEWIQGKRPESRDA